MLIETSSAQCYEFEDDLRLLVLTDFVGKVTFELYEMRWIYHRNENGEFVERRLAGSDLIVSGDGGPNTESGVAEFVMGVLYHHDTGGMNRAETLRSAICGGEG